MMSAMPYPVSVGVEPLLTNRNRLTTAFRLLLAIPHLILVGGVGAGFAYHSGGNSPASFSGETGVLGTFAFILAIVSWFTIVLGGEHSRTIREYTRFYLRWRVRALSYVMLLQDRYPPFGDAAYPTSLTVEDPTSPRNRVTVGFRLLLAVPHYIALFFVLFAWWVTTIVCWVAILITARYPHGLYEFGVGALRWLLRVEAYLLLMVDEYPPFTLN
jgi:hypothetical protein